MPAAKKSKRFFFQSSLIFILRYCSRFDEPAKGLNHGHVQAMLASTLKQIEERQARTKSLLDQVLYESILFS